MVKCDHLISLIEINLKIFIYSKYISIVSFYINISQFISKTRGLFFGGSVNHNYMCCLECSMVFEFADKSKYSRQLTTVRMWVERHYLENMIFGLTHSEHVDECDRIFSSTLIEETPKQYFKNCSTQTKSCLLQKEYELSPSDSTEVYSRDSKVTSQR